MFWSKKKDESFSFQTLTDEQRSKLISCIKDEIKELIESGGKVEAALDNFCHWNIASGDTLDLHYSVEIGLPALRMMIRGIR